MNTCCFSAEDGFGNITLITWSIVCWSGLYALCTQWPPRFNNSHWQWQCYQSSCHFCWHCHCPLVQSVQWCMLWCTKDCRAELRGGVLCSTAQLSQSLLWSRAVRSLHAGGGVSVRTDPEEERPPTMDEEEEDGEKMQANPAYLPIERSY